MTLSIGAVRVPAESITHQQHLSSLMTQAKKAAKAAGGNTWRTLEAGVATARPQADDSESEISVVNAT